MAARLPVVTDGHLDLPNAVDAAQIEIDSPAWFAWLELPDTRSFTFRDTSGHFTARKERRQREGEYWIAYRKAAGTPVRDPPATPARRAGGWLARQAHARLGARGLRQDHLAQRLVRHAARSGCAAGLGLAGCRRCGPHAVLDLRHHGPGHA